MKKLRLLLFEDCNRSCEGCCNNDWDLASLPVCESFQGYDEIMLTGGEPMLDPDLVAEAAAEIEIFNPEADIILYTASPYAIIQDLFVLDYINGLTVTLHEPEDAATFSECYEQITNSTDGMSLRLNVFEGVDLTGVNTDGWQVKENITWIKDCPLPEDEEFMRLKQ